MIDHLKIGLLNATGVAKSPDEIIEFCNNNNIDLILITETFLVRGRLYTDWHQYHNYAIQPNPKKRGQGSISLLVRPTLNLHIHHLPIINRFTLSFRIGLYTFHGLYLPPPPTLNDDTAIELLDQLTINEYTIILGDLNARSKLLTGDHSNNNRGLKALEPWVNSKGLHVWNGSLTRTQPTFRTIAGNSIIDLFISMESALNNPVMNIYNMNSLSTHHHLCTFSFFPHTPWQPLPQPNSTRQHWKLQRLSDPEVRQLYIQNFDDKSDSISQFLDRSFNSPHSIVHEPTIEQVSHDLISAIYTSLNNSITRNKARPKY